MNTIFQLRIHHLDQLNEQRIRAGSADALAISNACRVDSRMALEKISELRESLASKGIQYAH